MSKIPDEILQVTRPTNTVVFDRKTSSLHRYAVRERSGTYVGKDGKKKPLNGKVVGHIIDPHSNTTQSIPGILPDHQTAHPGFLPHPVLQSLPEQAGVGGRRYGYERRGACDPQRCGCELTGKG